MPASSDGMATASKRRCSGSGTSLTVTRVITPSVPSEPTNSCVSSGPTACRGTGSVSITSPVGVTTRSATTQVLDLAVARREHARAARGDVAADRRPLGRGGEVREREAALVERALERAAVVAGLDGRGQRRLVDLDDPVHGARRRARRRRPHGTAAPITPEPPPRGTTGTPCSVASRSVAATSSSLVAQHHRVRQRRAGPAARRTAPATTSRVAQRARSAGSVGPCADRPAAARR